MPQDRWQYCTMIRGGSIMLCGVDLHSRIEPSSVVQTTMLDRRYFVEIIRAVQTRIRRSSNQLHANWIGIKSLARLTVRILLGYYRMPSRMQSIESILTSTSTQQKRDELVRQTLIYRTLSDLNLTFPISVS